jgi:hypothetical protein
VDAGCPFPLEGDDQLLVFNPAERRPFLAEDEPAVVHRPSRAHTGADQAEIGGQILLRADRDAREQGNR